MADSGHAGTQSLLVFWTFVYGHVAMMHAANEDCVFSWKVYVLKSKVKLNVFFTPMRMPCLACAHTPCPKHRKEGFWLSLKVFQWYFGFKINSQHLKFKYHFYSCLVVTGWSELFKSGARDPSKHMFHCQWFFTKQISIIMDVPLLPLRDWLSSELLICF